MFADTIMKKGRSVAKSKYNKSNKGGNMTTVTGIVYSLNTNEILAEITGDQNKVEQYVDQEYDGESCGLTYSQHGLIETTDTDIINI
jgi:glutamine cyclotransferase